MLSSTNISAAAQETVCYTCPAGKTRTSLSVSLCNTSSSPVTFRIALTAAVAPTAGSYIEYEVTLPGSTSYERTGLVLLSTQTLYVQVSLANVVSVVVYGIEE